MGSRVSVTRAYIVAGFDPQTLEITTTPSRPGRPCSNHLSLVFYYLPSCSRRSQLHTVSIPFSWTTICVLPFLSREEMFSNTPLPRRPRAPSLRTNLGGDWNRIGSHVPRSLLPFQFLTDRQPCRQHRHGYAAALGGRHD